MHFLGSNAAGQDIALQRAVTSESINVIEFQLQNFGGEGALEAANLAGRVVLEDF